MIKFKLIQTIKIPKNNQSCWFLETIHKAAFILCTDYVTLMYLNFNLTYYFAYIVSYDIY